MSAATTVSRPARPSVLTKAQQNAITTLRGAASLKKVTNGWREGGTPFVANATANCLTGPHRPDGRRRDGRDHRRWPG